MDIRIVVDMLGTLADLEEGLISARAARNRHDHRGERLGGVGDEMVRDAVAAREAAASVADHLRRLERALEEVASTMNERRGRLAGLSEERQARAVRQEIENLERRREALEAEALGLLSSLEAAEAAVEEARADVRRQASRARAELETLSAAAARGADAIDAAEEESRRLLAMLPGDIVRRIRRLSTRGGSTTVRVRGGACGGCFAMLPAQMVLDVEHVRVLVHCPECGRFLVRQS